MCFADCCKKRRFGESHKIILQADPGAAKKMDAFGIYPLHYAREASPDVISILLEAYVVAEEKTDRIGSSLLTFGITNSTSKRWASHALGAYPNSANETNKAGCYPLYRGLQEKVSPASPGAILTVLDSYTDAAGKVWRGKSCLHIGMEIGASKGSHSSVTEGNF